MKMLILFCLLFGLLPSINAAAGDLQMLNLDGRPSDELVETLLYPGAFNRRFIYISQGDEAQYCLDSSLGAEEPFAQVYPERIVWPRVGGVELVVDKLNLRLLPAGDWVTDDELDKGFAIKWILEAVGQDFSVRPVFKMRAVGAEVFSTEDAKVLMHWEMPKKPEICKENPESGFPVCALGGISLETQAVAINVDATLLALAVTGLKPRIELYDIKATPVLLWQSTFSDVSGGVNDVAFSADGKFVVALLGNGRIHRFDAGSGGRHLAVLSRGTATASVPPGALVAVGGEKGEVVLWRLEDGTIDWKIHPRKSRGDIDKIAVSGDGRIIAALEYAGDKTIVRLWRVHNKWALGQFELDGTLYADIALNKTGDTLFLSHEERGLYTLAVNQKESKPVLFSEDTRMCRGKISWINSQDSLQCSSVNAIARVKMAGGKPSLLETGIVSDRWIISVSLQGTTTAAVGAGHLLIWR